MTGTLPLAYSSWNFLRVFELGGTQLTGSIPTVYNTAWLSLENFTLDGAAVGGSVPDAFTWSNLTWYTLQNTPVTSNSTNVFWLLKPQASTLQRLQGLRLGKRGSSNLVRKCAHTVTAVCDEALVVLTTICSVHKACGAALCSCHWKQVAPASSCRRGQRSRSSCAATISRS